MAKIFMLIFNKYMQIHFPQIKYIMAGSVLSGALLAITPTSAMSINQPQQDTFAKDSVPPSGTTNEKFLASAPSPNVKVCGENKKAKFVVDISKNVLYTYDQNGQPTCAYRIASGKASTPTHTGIRIVSHTETYPYRTAPRHTKRRRTPRAFGPKAIIIDILDTKTGERSQIGEFIHGNNDSTSIGKYASKGCMRMDNEVIKELAKNAKRGDIVIILKSDKK